jgi:hypothetical protein
MQIEAQRRAPLATTGRLNNDVENLREATTLKAHAIRLGAFAMALGVVFGGARRADADLVYDNGSYKAGDSIAYVGAGNSISNSFTVATPISLAEAQVELLASPGDVPTGVSWSIGTSAFGSEISSGTASLTSIPTGGHLYGSYPLFESTFSLSGTVTAGTTYFLTLTNISTVNNGPAYWTESGGPSSAFAGGGNPINSESFQLYGTAAAVPEPATITQLGIAAACLIGYRLRRLKRRD